MSVDSLKEKAGYLCSKYCVGVSEDLVEELQHLKSIHSANLQDNLSAFQLLNNLCSLYLNVLFPNVCIALTIFCTLPVTVAGAERSFSALAT